MSITPKTYENKILTKGLQSALSSTPIEDGILRFTTDTGRLYLDVDDHRVRISSVEDSLTEEEILNLLVPLPKIYVASDTGRAYISIDAGWVDIGPVKLEATTEDSDCVLWLSGTDEDQPKYGVNLKYNPSTETLSVPNLKTTTVTVGDMIITDTKNADNSHTVEFSFS